MMRRLIAALAAVLLVLTAGACGESGREQREKTESSLVLSYLELAEEQYESGDIQAAIATLSEGYSETGDRQIKNRLDELERETDQNDRKEKIPFTNLSKNAIMYADQLQL